MLNSLHKYQPRIHVVPIDSQTEPSATKDQRSSLSDALCASKFSSKSKSYIADSNLIDNKIATFTFEETQFIAVTAYQNEDVRNCSKFSELSFFSFAFCR